MLTCNKKSSYRSLIPILLIPLLLSCGVEETSTPAPVTAPATPPAMAGSLIAYASADMQGAKTSYSIMLLDLVSGSLINLTGTEGLMYDPAWSPDGSRTAYVSCTEVDCSLYVIDVETRAVSRLTKGDGFDREPSWSPDGKRIVFSRTWGGNTNLNIIEVDGGQITALTDRTSRDSEPDWSPDGSRIVFYSERFESGDLYTIRPDGSDLRRLTNDANGESGPDWSPDGRRIAFASSKQIQADPYLIQTDLYLMDADGSNLVQLTDDAFSDGAPDWSADGKQLLFHSDRDGNMEIYVMDIDGTNLRRLTHDARRQDVLAVWQPVAGSGVVIVPPEDIEPPAPSEPEHILFTSERSGNFEIYVMDVESGKVTNLTNHPADDVAPRWSPDGGRIAFISDRDGQWGIYLMNADGSGISLLTTNIYQDGQDFVWSPDGRYIAYRGDGEGTQDIYILDVDSGQERNLTNTQAGNWSLAWSPDGSQIAFESNRTKRNWGWWDIYVMSVEGSEPLNLTNCQGICARFPAWSPDGKRIAFLYDVNDTGQDDIFMANPDGSNWVNLTNDATDESYFRWSPDSNSIAFVSDRNGSSQIFVMNADGSGQRLLTDLPYVNMGFNWSPDSSRIVFVSDVEGDYEIYVVNADGSGLTRLTHSPGNDGAPSWQPSGDTIQSGPAAPPVATETAVVTEPPPMSDPEAYYLNLGDLSDWRIIAGSWEVTDNTLVQNDSSVEGTKIMFIGSSAARPDCFTFRAIAQPLEGREGMLIIFPYQGRYVWWNIGGWDNRASRVEGISRSEETLTEDTVTYKYWYLIQVTVRGDTAAGWLNLTGSSWQPNPLRWRIVRSPGEVEGLPDDGKRGTGLTGFVGLGTWNSAVQFDDYLHLIPACDVLSPDRIDVNSASLEALATIPDFGLEVASAIVYERSQGGPFQSIEDLISRLALDHKFVDGISPYVVVK